MAAKQPEHRFFFLSDVPIHWEEALPPNVTPVVLGPASRQLLLQKYWWDVKLPLWLRKIQADVVVSLDGMASLTTKVPQCVLVPDLRYLQAVTTYSKSQRAYYKQFVPRFLKKANRVMVPTVYMQNELAKHYHLKKEKTAVLNYAVPDWFYPEAYDVKESIKASFAQGHEYFLYKGLIHEDYNLVNLLKAFSFFKKRQQSSWKLLLAGPFQEGKNEFQKLLMAYKYKEDVVVTGALLPTEERAFVASAYALISPAITETVDPAIWAAIQCGVPAMVAATATNKELFGDSVMVFDGKEPADLAEWIMQVYRHESERNVFIEKGKNTASQLSWEQATAALWQCVVQAANA